MRPAPDVLERMETRRLDGLENPLLDRYLAAFQPGDLGNYMRMLGSLDAIKARYETTFTHSWAVPSEQALRRLLALGPLVEVGAGGGYWTALLRARGGDVAAYDLRPHGGNYHVRCSWTEVRRGYSTVGGRHPDRALFLCWPPYSSPMAARALAAHAAAGGRVLAYVGEGPGGCTADDAFFALLEREYDEVDVLSIPQWPGIHDDLSIYERKPR